MHGADECGIQHTDITSAHANYGHKTTTPLAVMQEAMEGDASKRKFNSVANEGGETVTAEEMEAFRLKKQRTDDPMAKLDASTGGYDLLS